MKRGVFFSFLRAAPLCLLAPAAGAQDPPGSHHAALVALRGDWLVAGRLRLGPQDDWSALSAEVKIEALLGDRFITERILGQPTEGSPERYEGVRILGYDNTERRFVYTILSNFQTGMLTMAGNRVGDALTLRTASPEWKTVYSYESPDRFILREYPQTGENGEYLGLEAIYTRIRPHNPLLGRWSGVHLQGERMTFVFDNDGNAQWEIQSEKINATFDLSYRIDLSAAPHHIELYGFQEGPLAGTTMFGILSFDGADAFGLDLEPGEADSTGESVRPAEFSNRTLTCRRER